MELARQEGGTVLCGGGPPSEAELSERCRGGFFYRPTVLEGLPHCSRVAQVYIYIYIYTHMYL